MLEQDTGRKGWQGWISVLFPLNSPNFIFLSSNLGSRVHVAVFEIMKKCNHFEWMDEYIERLQFEGYIDANGAATCELNLGLPPIAVETMGSSDRGADRVVPMRNARNAELIAESELNEELKKIKKHLKQMIDLQKQANIMAGRFFGCIIALFFFYLFRMGS